MSFFVVLFVCSVGVQAHPLSVVASANMGIFGTQWMIYNEIDANSMKNKAFQDDLMERRQDTRLAVFNSYQKNIFRAGTTSVLLNVTSSICFCTAGILSMSNPSLVTNTIAAGVVSLGSSAVLAYGQTKLVDRAIKKTNEVPEIQHV